MPQVVKLMLAAAFVLSMPVTGFAQLSIPPTPLNLGDDLSPVQTPAYGNFSDARCDRDGTIYMRHEGSGDQSWEIAKFLPDGTVEQTRMAPVPGFGDTHTFAVATSDGGAVQEVVRAWDTSDHTDAPSVYYLQFDEDGNFRSRQEFESEFIPAMLLPLPSGNFFAAGVMLKTSSGIRDVEEVPLAGIFDSDTHLLSKLQNAVGKAGAVSNSSSSDSDIAEDIQLGGHVSLGGDGNLYVLLSGTKTRVRVYRQTGELLREMSLRQPFEDGLATGIWVSGGRMLVTYEGEAENARDAITYIEYDSGSGQLIRAYRPQFTGTVACFQDGQTLTVLVKQKDFGSLAIGSVDLP